MNSVLMMIDQLQEQAASEAAQAIAELQQLPISIDFD
jgi:hypothetical protein